MAKDPEERAQGWLHTLEALSKVVAVVLTPVVVGVVGNSYSASIKEREREVEIMKLIPQLLSQELPGIRLWAVDVVSSYSGVEVPQEARAQIEDQPLDLVFGARRGRITELEPDEADVLLAGAREAGTERWMRTAIAEMGEAEIPGDDHNPRILEYHASAGVPDVLLTDEFPWNASFVNWVMSNAGFEGPPQAASARAWLDWGRPIGDPVVGAIAIISHEEASEPMTTGTVGFFIAADEEAGTVTLLSGNSANGVNIYTFPWLDRLRGYRVPQDYPTGR